MVKSGLTTWQRPRGAPGGAGCGGQVGPTTGAHDLSGVVTGGLTIPWTG